MTDKHRKFGDADNVERGFWDEHMHAFEQALGASNTGQAPWLVMPNDDKDDARLNVSQIVLDAFADLNMTDPMGGVARQYELRTICKQL